MDAFVASGELRGGPLPSKYKLEQIHAHWGRVEDEGSEHTVDGKGYPGEVNMFILILLKVDGKKEQKETEAEGNLGKTAVVLLRRIYYAGMIIDSLLKNSKQWPYVYFVIKGTYR